MPALIIIAILVVGLLLISTESVNRMNKAAVAMFMGALCWIIYILYGTQFVASEHPIDFLSFLSATEVHSHSVREFIAFEVFPPYVVQAAGVVLYLLGTMTIVEVLEGNGCFDFMREWLRTRSPRRFLWLVAAITFILSANIDNLTTACVMLSVVHKMLSDEHQRRVLGSVVVVSATCGGAFTVIGDVTSLSLWVNGLVKPSPYAGVVFLPILASLVTFLLLVQRHLPRRLSLVQSAPPFRGDDTLLNRPQRLLLLFVGIGGLWFIPSFHRFTDLPAFLGALCVLSLLWIVNELSNRRLIGSDVMTAKRRPMALQYTNVQNILFFIGLALSFGAINETGVLNGLFNWSTEKLDNTFLIASSMGLLSSFLGNVTAVVGNIQVFSPGILELHPELIADFGAGGIYWPLLSFSTAMGSSLLAIGTLAGFALMRMEGVTLAWYIRHITLKIVIAWAVGFAVLNAMMLYAA